jgi:uncharacterized glyoxalase superfamily protein PhnB
MYVRLLFQRNISRRCRYEVRSGYESQLPALRPSWSIMKSEICLPYVQVKDAHASLDYYERCLGFHKLSEHRFTAGLPLVIGIERGGLQFLLTEHAGDGAFGICVYCYIDDDVDEFCRRCRAAGGHITQELENMPWARDFAVTDPDGNVIRFGNRRE